MESSHLLESNDVRIDEDDKIYILGFEQTVGKYCGNANVEMLEKMQIKNDQARRWRENGDL